jgi:hypothetical protein
MSDNTIPAGATMLFLKFIVLASSCKSGERIGRSPHIFDGWDVDSLARGSGVFDMTENLPTPAELRSS